MRSNRFVLFTAIALLILSACTSAPAPESALSASPDAASTDALTGMWSGDWGPTETHRNNVMLDLKWSGSQLSGTVNPGASAIQLTKASYDAATGNVMMETDAKGHDGKMVHYMIEGKLEGTTMMGTWNHGDQKGDFKITKK
jgi:hypothetical protein